MAHHHADGQGGGCGTIQNKWAVTAIRLPAWLSCRVGGESRGGAAAETIARLMLLLCWFAGTPCCYLLLPCGCRAGCKRLA